MNIEYYNPHSSEYRGHYLKNPLVDNYKTVALDMLCFVFPSLSRQEIELAVEDHIMNRLQDTKASINNNYKKQEVDMTLLQVAGYIFDRKPIITAYGVMFKRHGEVPNPVYNLIDGFINNRKKLKKEMFKYPKGSEMFERYNLLQLLAKIDANGFYGLVIIIVPIWSNPYKKIS